MSKSEIEFLKSEANHPKTLLIDIAEKMQDLNPAKARKLKK